MKKLISKWYLVIVAGFMVFAGLVFALSGEDSIIAVHDNLDLFIPQFQMMKDTKTFFGHGVDVPFLGGISRDVLPAEFSLYTVLYMILPAYPAYIAGYLLKILIALFSCVLLAKDVCGEKYVSYKPIVYLSGLAYGVLNVFPAFGIPFASIPLVIYFVRRIYRQPCLKWYAALFFYPFLSYFSYFGLFILGYMAVALIWLWIRDKKFPGRILLAVCVLAAGYIACEYRLFATMLLGDEVTIRSTMEAGSFSAAEIVKTIGEVFAKGMFHAESMHTYIVLPVCVVYFVFLNAVYIVKKDVKGIFHDLYNLLMLVLVFNSVIYGIYYWEGFRNVVETICPPLTGWQFNRTVFFSPFIWYAAFFLVLKRLYDSGKKHLKAAANLLAAGAVFIIVLSGTRYNDLYHTCFDQAYWLIKGQKTQQLSFGEFYSQDLFEQAKKDIGYQGEWSAAYGFYPATLEYNGIATLDGYLGFYAQSYKEAFRRIIAPALKRVEESRDYFDSWGARAYLYSGTDLSIVNAQRSLNVTDRDIYIDVDAFKALGGRYIFSRIELTNEAEAGFALIGVYTDQASPYTLYVYETKQDEGEDQARQENIPFSRMKLITYDKEFLEEQIDLITRLSLEAVRTGKADRAQEMIDAYIKIEEELEKLETCYAIAEITYYQDVRSGENQARTEALLEEVVHMEDKAYSAIGKACASPYLETMKTIMDPLTAESFAEYEEITGREKEIALEENRMIQAYEQALGKEDNQALGEIFLELVRLRNEEAVLNGYDHYADYAYTELYVRDYTIEEAKELFREIKEQAVPVIDDMYAVLEDNDYYAIYERKEEHSGEEVFDAVRPYLDEIAPELGASMDHMMECGLYDMDEAPGKTDIGFTIDLDYFDDAYILVSPYGDYYDYGMAVHEFGHYHEMYRNTESILERQNNLDVDEICSQGLEMLYYDYYKELFGEEGDAVAFLQVYAMAEGIADAARISEFEIAAYENPDLTLEELDELYRDLSEKYGFYGDAQDLRANIWTEIPHIYSSPCYYISYLTSAFSSLDLLMKAENDWDGAVKTYLEIIEQPSYIPYCTVAAHAGLRDIFEDGVPKAIIEETADLLQVYE